MFSVRLQKLSESYTAAPSAYQKHGLLLQCSLYQRNTCAKNKRTSLSVACLPRPCDI